MKNEDLLLIFTKNPDPGKVKTRLAKDIGNEKAVEIYKILVRHSRNITSSIKAERQVWYAGEIPENDIWDQEIYIKKKQDGKDLGERMFNAFEEGFADGFKNIVIIGTDIFDIQSKDIEVAFKNLRTNDFVIGPASDGGYYLLGMNSLNSEVFKNKNWSTSSVFRDTLYDMEDYRVKILPQRKDIDIVEDLQGITAFQKIIKND